MIRRERTLWGLLGVTALTLGACAGEGGLGTPEVSRAIVALPAPVGGDQAKVVETFSVSGNTPDGEVVDLDGITFSGKGQYLVLAIVQVDETDSADSDKAWTAPVWFEGTTTAQPVAGGPRIISTIKNTSNTGVTMSGWKLRDLAEKTWSLDSLGMLQPGQQKTIQRNGQAMAPNNGGDTVSLIDLSGKVV